RGRRRHDRGRGRPGAPGQGRRGHRLAVHPLAAQGAGGTGGAGGAGRGGRAREARSEPIRTGLPGPSAVQRARVDSALRELTARATDGLPEPWPRVVRQAAPSATADLPDLLDRTVAGTNLGTVRRPRWELPVGFLQAVLAVAAVAGLGWLLVVLGAGLVAVPRPPL